MTAPSIKEALFNLVEAVEASIDLDRLPNAFLKRIDAAKSALATLSPPAGDRRDAIARIIAGPLCDATKGEHTVIAQGFCAECGETISRLTIGMLDARNKADAILASGLVQDEAATRAGLISLILDMGRVIRVMDEDNLQSAFWTQDGDYIIDSRFPK